MTSGPITVPTPLDDFNPEATFNTLVKWVEEIMTAQRAPGLLVGLSGTDSILTFLICAKALENLGKGARMLGVNFEHASKNELAKEGTVVCLKEEFNWVAQDILPWLQQKAPQARFEIDNSIPHSDDNKRWGHLLSRAVRDIDPRHGFTASHYFVVGSRNGTENELGLYSQISKSVSLLPILPLLKSEVIALCEWLGVPQIAIDKSREIDCDCGRFDVQANHMRELDLYIMFKRGRITKDTLEQSMPKDVLIAVRSFYTEEKAANAYRNLTPYIAPDVVIGMRP